MFESEDYYQGKQAGRSGVGGWSGIDPDSEDARRGASDGFWEKYWEDVDAERQQREKNARKSKDARRAAQHQSEVVLPPQLAAANQYRRAQRALSPSSREIVLALGVIGIGGYFGMVETGSPWIGAACGAALCLLNPRLRRLFFKLAIFVSLIGAFFFVVATSQST